MNKKDELQMTPAAIGALANGDIANFLAAATPGGIEAQEAQGQQDLVASTSFPKEMLHRTEKKHFEKLGFVFGDEIDDIFVSVTMPSGWRKVATDHSMWSDLIDNKGRKRGAIFYKAAFYDRSAHVSLSLRYRAGYEPADRYKTDMPYEERTAGNWHGVVLDGDNIVWKTEAVQGPDYKEQDRLNKEAKKWLKKNFPKHEDLLAYWE